MKILITGGAGFIGSNFIYYWQEKYPDDYLVCLDALTYAGKLETLSAAIKNHLRFEKGDICDRQFVYHLFSEVKFDTVVNFAAESHVDRSLDNSEIFLKTNILGTQVLMEACRKYGINRFHQVSTDEVYGDLPLNDQNQFNELTPLHPSSPYSASKASADLLALAYYRTYQLPITISRCSNNYGPYQYPEKLIPLMIIKAMQNQSLPVYGDGLNIRDWLYVTDHCFAIDLIIHLGKNGEVYNIGGHNERSNLEIVRKILECFQKPESLITFVTDRPGHDRRYAIDNTKISSELGWIPQMSFDDGLMKTIKWYIDHQDWWQI